MSKAGIGMAALLLLAACASPADRAADAARELETLLAGRVAGKPQTCLPSNLRDGPRIIAPDMLVYGATRGRLWITRAQDCPFLRRDDIIIADMFGSQQCRNDMIRTLPRTGGIVSPACRLGDFTPWDRTE